MRTINGAGTALLDRALAGETIPIVQLVRVDLATTLYLTTAGHEITWDSHTWSPAGIGSIEAVQDSADEIAPLKFTLPGLTSDQVAVALDDDTEGATVRVYDALINPSTGVCADAVLAWSGTLNVPTLQDGQQAILTVTAEHRGVSALRVKPSRYTNSEQQRLHTGDTSLDIDPKTDAAPLVWPAASYFKK